MSIDPTGRLLAFANEEDDRLFVRDLDTSKQLTAQHHSEVVDARFDGRGRLWTARREDSGFVVELRTGTGLETLATCAVSDSYFAQGGAEIRAGPSDDAMFVAAYSGQSEQENYLCEFGNGTLLARHIAGMDGEQFVFVSPDGGKALTYDHETCEICCFEPPFNKPIERLPWPDYVEGVSEDERPGYYGCYIGSGHLLAGSQEGRLFLVELAPLRVRKEFHVLGHAPVHASVKYPSVSDVQGFASDLTLFGRCGNCVAAFFAKNHNHPSQQLTLLPISALIGE